MFEELWQQIIERFDDFLTTDLLPETAALVAILLSGLLLTWILKRALKRLKNQLQHGSALKYASWLQQIVVLGLAVVLPLSLWIMGHVGISLFEKGGWPHGVLDYIIPFFGLWLLYRLLTAVIDNYFKPEQRHLWKDQILRPTMIVLLLMHVVGVLDGILAYQITITKDVAVPVGSILSGLFVIYLFVLLGRWVQGLLRDVLLPKMEADPSVIPIIATFSSYAIILIGVFVGLMVAGVDLTAVAVILGGLSVGIGFGMQELINNFSSGFILLFERSLVPGDIIETDGASGVVKDIRLRTTHIRTFDNMELIVPNGQLLGGTLINYSQKKDARHKRIHITVGASYNDNPHEVMAALMAAAKACPGVLADPAPQIFLMEFGDNSINYELRVWVADANMMVGVSSTLRLAIWDTFATNQFEMPYPQRDVHIIEPTVGETAVVIPEITAQEMQPIATNPPEGELDMD